MADQRSRHDRLIGGALAILLASGVTACAASTSQPTMGWQIQPGMPTPGSGQFVNPAVTNPPEVPLPPFTPQNPFGSGQPMEPGQPVNSGPPEDPGQPRGTFDLGQPPASFDVGVPLESLDVVPPVDPTLTEAPLPTPAVTTASILRFDPWFVTDPMANDIKAMTFLAPQGWQVDGSVVWLPEWRVLTFLQTRVVEPNSGLTIEWLPNQNFIWFEPPAGLPQPPIGGNYQGKAYVPPPNDAVQFVRDFYMPGLLGHLTNATVTRVDDVPAVADEFVKQYGGPATANAFRIRYQYEQNGQQWEEDVFFAWLFGGAQPPLLWYVNFAYTVRAPLGMIDANPGLISTVVASRTTTPEWEAVYRLCNELFTQGLQQQLADTEAFGRALQQYRAESQALQQQVVAERQASQDRIAQLRGESLQGIDNYVNPYDQTIVQLPQDWNTYWVNPQGEYIVADEPGFDPNAYSELGTWERLQPTN